MEEVVQQQSTFTLFQVFLIVIDGNQDQNSCLSMGWEMQN